MSGAYILYRNSQRKTEVQIATQLCYPEWSDAYCICGIAVRTGRTVYVKDYCRVNYIPFDGYINDEGDLNWYRSSFLHDMFYTNYGTMIEVMSFPWMGSPMFFINIYPSAADINNVDGLCGKFNGDPTDDFVHRDGTTEVTDPWLYYTTSTMYSWFSWVGFTTFHLSWEVSDEDDLTDPNTANWQNLDTVDAGSSSVCVCPGDHTEAVCSQNEAHLCTTGSGKRGTVVTWFRKKRSVSPEERHTNLMLKREKRNTDRLLRKKRQATTVTEEDVELIRQGLESSLNSGCAGYELKDDSNVNLDVTQSLKSNAMDKLRLPQVDVASSLCVGIQAVVETKVTNNNQADETLKATAKSMCNCNTHGTCPSGGVCVCDFGYTETDCSVDLNKEVIAYAVETANSDITLVGIINQLDVKASVTQLHVTVSLSSSTPWCKYLIQYADSDGRLGSTVTYYELGIIVTYIEIICPIPTDFGGRRRRRSTTTTTATQYTVSVGNNGVDGTFGSSQTVIEIDDSCQNITTDAKNETLIVLQSGYCLISGLCYANGITSTANTCDKCDTTLDVFAWSADTVTASCQTSTTTSSPVTTNNDGLQGYVIGLIGMGSILAVALVGITVFLIYKYGLKHSQVVPGPPPGLYDTAPSRTHFKLRIDPVLAEDAFPVVESSQLDRILNMASIDFAGLETPRAHSTSPGPSGVTAVNVSEAPDTTWSKKRLLNPTKPTTTEKTKGYKNGLFF